MTNERFDALISSDLQRARATLAPLAEFSAQPVRLDVALVKSALVSGRDNRR